MAIDRRALIGGSSALLASAVWGSFSRSFAANDSNTDCWLVSACRRADGRFALIVFTPQGRIVREIPLAGRGHDVAYHQLTGRIVSFARRPGRFAVGFNARDNSPPMLFAPPVDRHFYGHGAFSLDGRLLFASENDFNAARGVIGVFDASGGYQWIGEFPSYGVGPHEILLMPDGKTLVVANGGIETHPESGREKLNLTTMEPSLCFVDIETGDLKVRHRLARDLHRLSVRHLAASDDGSVWFGGQWQGDRGSTPELIGSASVEKPVELLSRLRPLGAALKGYVGSVVLSADGRWLAASAPRAGQIIFIDTVSGAIQRRSDFRDGCGVAPMPGGSFAVSSGLGVVHLETPDGDRIGSASLPKVAFDNHMRTVR